MNRVIEPATNRLLFFDMVRNLAMLSVVAYHAVAAYSTVTPHWGLHDGSFVIADVIRHLFDVFQMPVFFFVAGYFALPSLTRHGWWVFLKGKLKRIGIPWVLGVFLLVPVFRHMGHEMMDGGPHPAFWADWLAYLKSFGTFQIGLFTPERTSQFHFWFLSLLLSFFVIVGLYHAVRGGRSVFNEGSRIRLPASSKSILATLFAAAVLTSTAYCIVLLLVPETSWVSINLLLFFQPTSLVTYIACFALGGFAASRQWFAGDAFPDRLTAWITMAILLTLAFFVAGREIFAHPSTSHRLPFLLLLAFSFIRTFLCLTFLVLIIAYSRKYWNRPSRFNQNLSVNSYNIYLVHFFFVIALQSGLTDWRGGSPTAKAGIVFLLALPFSYGLSRVIDRFPRGFVLFLVALFLFFCVGRYMGL
jgi:hypothetical protein